MTKYWSYYGDGQLVSAPQKISQTPQNAFIDTHCMCSNGIRSKNPQPGPLTKKKSKIGRIWAKIGHLCTPPNGSDLQIAFVDTTCMCSNGIRSKNPQPGPLNKKKSKIGRFGAKIGHLCTPLMGQTP